MKFDPRQLETSQILRGREVGEEYNKMYHINSDQLISFKQPIINRNFSNLGTKIVH